MAVFGHEECKCGNPLPTLRKITGRVTDHFVKEDRTIIHGEYFTHLQWCWIPRFFFSGEGQLYRPGDEKPYLDILDNLIHLSVGDKTRENGLFGKKVEFSSSKAGDAEVETTINK